MKQLLLLSLLVFSCGDPCDDLDCGTGTCLDGVCDCPDGYSGTNCEIFDPCFNVNCGDNGTCVDGTCDCDDGYEGELCDTEVRAKFLGNWVSEGFICDGMMEDMAKLLIEADDTFDVTITDPEDTTFVLNADVSGDQIIIPFQQVDFGAFFASYEGTMTLENNILKIVLTISALGETINCTGEAVKS